MVIGSTPITVREKKSTAKSTPNSRRTIARPYQNGGPGVGGDPALR